MLLHPFDNIRYAFYLTISKWERTFVNQLSIAWSNIRA